MELSYDLDGRGWAAARISDGSHYCEFRVSFLSDALGDMAKAAVMLLNGSREESCSFEDEPGQHRFILTRGDNDSLTIRVLWFEDSCSGRADRFGEEVFRCECAVLDFVRQVFTNLHRIFSGHGVDGYKKAWGKHEFPLRAYNEFQRRLDPSRSISGAHSGLDRRG